MKCDLCNGEMKLGLTLNSEKLAFPESSISAFPDTFCYDTLYIDQCIKCEDCGHSEYLSRNKSWSIKENKVVQRERGILL